MQITYLDGEWYFDNVPAKEYFKDKIIDYPSLFRDIKSDRQLCNNPYIRDHISQEYRSFIGGGYNIQHYNPDYNPAVYFSGLGLEIVEVIPGTGACIYHCKEIKNKNN